MLSFSDPLAVQTALHAQYDPYFMRQRWEPLAQSTTAPVSHFPPRYRRSFNGNVCMKITRSMRLSQASRETPYTRNIRPRCSGREGPRLSWGSVYINTFSGLLGVFRYALRSLTNPQIDAVPTFYRT